MKGSQSLILIAAVLAASLISTACQPKPKADNPSTTNKPGVTTPEPSLEPQDPATIPEKFKHDGFYYYGLNDGKELTYEFEFNGSKSKGTQKSVYVGMQNELPHFRIERSGALSSMGVDDVEVREDGVYLVSVREQALEKAALALPAQLEVGKTWTLEQNLTAGDGKSVSSTGTQKIVKQEQLKTPAGMFDTYVITLDGKMTMDGKTEPVSGKAWYSKEVGTVKLEVQSVDAEGKPLKYSITLISK